MTKADIEAELETLRKRIDALEHGRFMDEHEHIWKYQKTVHGRNGAAFWSWECVHPKCD